jgi:hypothetical protein
MAKNNNQRAENGAKSSGVNGGSVSKWRNNGIIWRRSEKRKWQRRKAALAMARVEIMASSAIAISGK